MGAGRSGTSTVAGLLSKSGYFMGQRLLQPTQFNQKGFFEDIEINRINEDILETVVPRVPEVIRSKLFPGRPKVGQRWLAYLPPNVCPRLTDTTAGQIQELLDNQPFCFKDPRFSYTLSAWRPYLKEAAFICVFRHPLTTVNSILAMAATDPHLAGLHVTPDRALRVWMAMYSRILTQHALTGDWLFIHHQQVLEKTGLESLATFTGADVDCSFPDKSLMTTQVVPDIPAKALPIYQELCDRAGCTAKC
ncbi:MAG: sulfotransferase [Gloeomargaritaceae cyanobacterium C42_A2020_066]|nr:sulfotransferase [Gloeomargaritaceae cyanobacterium C42_A2020_066]